jgi:hypothetical protein
MYCYQVKFIISSHLNLNIGYAVTFRLINYFRINLRQYKQEVQTSVSLSFKIELYKLLRLSYCLLEAINIIRDDFRMQLHVHILSIFKYVTESSLHMI